MPGSEFYEAGLRPHHIVGSVLGHDDVHKGCMVVRIAGERQRYFFPKGSLRAWAAAAAAAGSDDEPGFEYANEDGVVVEQQPRPMREASAGSLREPDPPSGGGEEAREAEGPSEGPAERDAHTEGATQAAAGEEGDGGSVHAAAADSSQPSSRRRTAAAAAVAAPGAKRPSPCLEEGEEQAGAHPTHSRRKRAHTLPEAAAAAAAVAASAAPHMSAPTTAPSAPHATPPLQQSGAPGSPGVGIGVGGSGDVGGAAGTTGVRKVAAGGRPKKRRGRAGTLREQLSDIVGKGVDIPGDVFGQDIPGFFYPARMVGPDKAHPGCVIVSIQDGSRARYFFPVPDVREWVAGMHKRLGLDWQEEHDTVDGESVAFAAHVLVDMAASGGGGHGFGWIGAMGAVDVSGAAEEQNTVKIEGEGEEGEEDEAAGARGVEAADGAVGDAALHTITAMASAVAVAEDGGSDDAVSAEAQALADAEPTTLAEDGVGVSMAGGAAGSGGSIGGRSASVSHSHISCSEERGSGGAGAAGGKHVPCGSRTGCDRNDLGCSDGDDGRTGSDGGSDADDGAGAGGGKISSHVAVGMPLHMSVSPAASGGGDRNGCADSSDADSPTGIMLMRPAHASTSRAPLSGAAVAAGVAVTDRRCLPTAAPGHQQQTQHDGWRWYL
ncbi:hypothetical protein FOA52_000585 [Chlamydomonas sp. UWO 241]|nr:hypothetical protein FOA52_000585 [Chlamydomonas sp. UWO 241]